MINQDSIQKVNDSKFSSQFVKPLYSSYCFSNIPDFILSLFGDTEKPARLPKSVVDSQVFTQGIDRVVFFLVDGLGWGLLEKIKGNSSFLKRIEGEGVISKLTAMFPSTTAGHVSCVATGLTSGESGIFEWYYYEPKLDRVIAPLLFSFAGDKTPGTLANSGITPADIYPTKNIYSRYLHLGVEAYAFVPKEYAFSPFNNAISTGAQVRPYKTLPQGLTLATDVINSSKTKTSYYFYFPTVDSVAHEFGASSPFTASEAEAFFLVFEKVFLNNLSTKGKTLILISADHGGANTDPNTTYYLNIKAPEIRQWLKTNKSGDIIAPGGSCRDFFLYVKEENIDEALTFLRDKLSGIAEVYKTQQLMDAGFFGPGELSQEFLSRVGNILILSYEGQSVWWFEKGKFEQHYFGHHGGLTPGEMEIPLLSFIV